MVRTLIFPKVVNAAKLDAEIRAVINAHLDGVVCDGVNTQIILTNAAPGSDDATVAGLVTAHDPTPVPDPLVVAVAQAKTDAGSTPIDNMTVAQAIAYINTNVTDLTSAKAALVIAVKYIGEMRRELNLINNKLGL